jgi:molybdate transport system substrate-binding protein
MKSCALKHVIACLILLMLQSAVAKAEEVIVAVATNFLVPAREVSAIFEKQTGNTVTLVSGATGKLTTQILLDAPFDILLAADQASPALLVERGAAIADSRFTYAAGSLVLWAKGALPLKGAGLETLDETRIVKLAMANPKIAPYGKAAMQVLDKLGLAKVLEGRIVYGENIGQAFAMVASGNVTAGFIAKSQVSSLADDNRGNWVDVPGDLHEPILQDAVLVNRARDKPAARLFMEFLKSPDAARLIGSFGYLVVRG